MDDRTGNAEDKAESQSFNEVKRKEKMITAGSHPEIGLSQNAVQDHPTIVSSLAARTNNDENGEITITETIRRDPETRLRRKSDDPITGDIDSLKKTFRPGFSERDMSLDVADNMIMHEILKDHN